MSISLFAQNTAGPGSAWKEMEAWRAKQRQFTEDFEAFNTNFSARLMDTFSSVNDGVFEITVRRAVAAARQRASERAKQSGVDKLV